MSSIRRYVYFFKAPGFSGEHSVMDSGSFRAEIVAVSKIEDVCGILPDMIKEGVDLVELCGSFGPGGAKLVSESIDGAVPVAYVSAAISKK